MSYQRIKTPKLYIDNINWLISSGKVTASDITSSGASMLSGSSIHEFFDMKPSNLQTIDCGGASAGFKLVVDTNLSANSRQDANFIAILGHNLKEAGAKISIQIDDSDTFVSPHNDNIISLTNIVNLTNQGNTDTGTNLATALTNNPTVTVQSGHGSRFSEGDIIKIDNETMYVNSISTDVLTVHRGFNGTQLVSHSSGASIYFTGYGKPADNGWSLATFTATTDNKNIRLIIDPDEGASDNFDADIKIGAILIGETHTLPHSPDLDIKKKFLFDGVKKQNSVGGQTYTHATFTKASSWFLEPFYNDDSHVAPERTDRSGRASLDMSFSYLDDTEVYGSENFGRQEVQENNTIVPNLINKTHSGMFPLLLQYDKDVATANDSFLWCRLNNEPSFTQVANQVWSTKLSFLEEF
tara:strand:- start:68 stop:1303 length:1236 start_codon:yes stop_codon:yes gene_type:complete